MNGQTVLEKLLRLAQSVLAGYDRLHFNDFLQMSIDEGVTRSREKFMASNPRFRAILHDGDIYVMLLERSFIKAIYAIFIKMSHNNGAKFRFPVKIEKIFKTNKIDFSRYDLTDILNLWANRIIKHENVILGDE